MKYFLLLFAFVHAVLCYRTVDDMRMLDDDVSISGYRKWPDGLVPYVVTNQFTSIERGRIHDALNQLNTKFGGRISFIPRDNNEYSYVKIIKGSGCWSYVGQVTGVQELSLGTGCVGRGIIQHEFIHAIGFLHAHQRTDRDDYVEIRSQNIMNGAAGNFRKERYDSRYNTPYDYKSVMHYRSTAFSENGRPTIVPRGDYNGELGNYDQATANDILRAARMYGAPVPTVPPTPQPTASPVACTPVPRGLQHNAFNLDNGPITLVWGPRGAVRITLGDYIGNGKKINKKTWRGGKTISILRGRKGMKTTVRAPGVKFEFMGTELTLERISDTVIRIGNRNFRWNFGSTLDMAVSQKSAASNICRT